MAKSWNRIETWFVLGVGLICLLVVAVMGLFAFMNATATPLHPDALEMPTVTDRAASPGWADAVDQAQQVARAGLVDQNLPGLSVAVGVGDEIVWAQGFGWADLDDRVPVDPETRFRIGTASTVLTSAGVGLLIEQGRLKLDDEIQAHVAAFPRSQWPVTLRHLMAHTAGVRTDGGDEGPLLAARCERPVDALQAFADAPLLFEPGTQFRYSSYGWILVSAAVEAAAGEPFLRFMRKEVFASLDMDDTGADSATESVAHKATSYFPRFAAEPYYGPDRMRDLDYSCYAGASVFVSTPSDMVRFAMAISGGRLLRPETVALLQAEQRLSSGDETGYGLGWDLEHATFAGQPVRVVGHDGDLLGGQVSSLVMAGTHGIAVSVISNTSYADTYGLAVKIAEAFEQQARRRAGK